MIRVYLAEATDFSEELLFEKGISLVSEKRKEKIQALHKQEAKSLSLATGLLLRYAFLDTLGTDLSHEIVLGAHGQPYLPKEELYFSLSHSKSVALCVISDAPIGCDIEAIREKTPHLSLQKKVYTNEEITKALILSEEVQQAFFFHLWTRKESFVKWMGRGIGFPFSEIPVWTEGKMQEELSYMGKNLYWKNYQKEGYAMALCAQTNDFPKDVIEVDTEMLTNY